MKKYRVANVYISVFLFAAPCPSLWASTMQEYEQKALTLYMSDMTFTYKRCEVLNFNNLPSMRIVIYARSIDGEYDENLLIFARENTNGTFDELLSPDVNPKGVPPFLWSVNHVESDGEAILTLLYKVQGNGGLWIKELYRYTGVVLQKTESETGIGDPYHKDAVSGKYVPTPPSWWGPPVKTKWDRYRKDPATGATWMLIPDETRDGDKTSEEEKARRYRQDPETGYWWKRID